MTLKKFLLSGVSSKNVTLGVPRLKKVINVAKDIKTSMIHINLENRKSEEVVIKVQSQIENNTLDHLVTQFGNLLLLRSCLD